MTTPKATGFLRFPSVFDGTDICDSAQLSLHDGASSPRFEDDVWDLTQLAGRPRYEAASTYLWSFNRIVNPCWRTVAKEVTLALLCPTHPLVDALPTAPRTPAKPSTVGNYVRQLIRWFNWLTENGFESLSDVDSAICEQYIDYRLWGRWDSKKPPRKRTPKFVAASIKTLQLLSVYGPLPLADRYGAGFIPWEGHTADAAAGVKPQAENITPPVPQEVLGPLLANALYLIDVIGPHIAELVEHLRDNSPLWGNTDNKPALLTPAQYESVLGVLNEIRREGTPLVKVTMSVTQRRLNGGWDPDDPLLLVSPHPILRTAGMRRCPRDWIIQLREPLLETVRAVGIAGPYARDAAFVRRADNSGTLPWTEPLTGDQVDFMRRYVHGACAILTAALSGMRRSEVAEIRPDALSSVQTLGGGHRYRLTSRRVKGQKTVEGVEDEWIVIPEVHRAVSLADRLALPDQPTLFGPGDIASFIKTQRQLASSPVGERLGLSQIPEAAINGRMLRRTLAIELASRPGGLLAAKIHLKHVSVVTTEGYAGRPGGAQSLFHKEVQKEEDDQRMRLAIAAYMDYRNGDRPSGPGARQLLKTFALVDTALKDHPDQPPTVITNDRRIENLLQTSAKTLHLGVANYCWFSDPAKALCLKLAGPTKRSEPLAGMCDSSRCPQATHHRQHRAIWSQTAESLQVFLGNPRISKPERERLRTEHERAVRVVAEIDKSCHSTDFEGQE